jgi:DNA-binding transcriptional ArsR family regulator/uncharacterized protein YndB with AHSA1/START domain
VEDVFRALADPSRRQLLDQLSERGGQTLRELCVGKAMTRQSVTKHLAVLEDAGLVTTRRRGREKLHDLNAAPIGDIADRWISRFHRHRAEALADLRRALEDTAVQPTSFTYTTFIRTTPERLWQALTDPAFTRRYWQGIEFETDWQKGSPMVWRNESLGLRVEDPAQIILEADPYRRLSYAWHTFTEEWGRAYGIPDDDAARYRTERRSKVTFDLEPVGETVMLVVVHDDFAPGSAGLDGISQAWPWILSSLKSLLESGETLPPW